MASFFKDITNYLNKLYPDSKVYVIGDEHFYHANIIGYERNNFTSLDQMHEEIIKKHNSVVTKDDIVIYLGDFSFKKGEIPNLLQKLNGHPFLVMGNHDNVKTINSYKALGFEDVFLFPVKFNDILLSHYPLKGEHPDTALYNLLAKEFEKSGCINIHGHEHTTAKNYERSLNVSCENIDYKPYFIGSTTQTFDKREFLLASKEFLELLKKEDNINVSLIANDYIYSIMLSSLKDYANDTAFFGSYMLFKKYGYVTNISDLDSTLIYNPNISEKANMLKLRKIVESVFTYLNSIEGFNIDFYKRKSILCMLYILYANGYSFTRTYLDMNVILASVYKPDDFVLVEGKSEIEKLFQKKYPEYLDKFCMPHFLVKSVNAYGELANMLLQYLYQESDMNKKDILRKKMMVVAHNLDFTKDIEDYLIRYYIRNILFFSKLNRNDELQRVFNSSPYETKLLRILSPLISDEVSEILVNESSDFNYVKKELARCKTKELSIVSKEILLSK